MSLVGSHMSMSGTLVEKNRETHLCFHPHICASVCRFVRVQMHVRDSIHSFMLDNSLKFLANELTNERTNGLTCARGGKEERSSIRVSFLKHRHTDREIST